MTDRNETTAPLKTAAEVGALYRVHERTVRRWAARGCPVLREGRMLRFLADDVAAWLKTRAQLTVRVGGETDLQGVPQ